MARDRQRAKARKQRRTPQESKRDDATRDDARAGLPGQDDEGLPEPRAIHRENVPGPVEHTGDVDQFEAALVAGSEGQPADDPDAAERAALGEDDSDPADAFGGDREEPTGLESGEQPVEAGAVAARNAEQPVHGRGGSRFMNFLRASWAELQRVQWPDRRQVGQATAVVMGFVVVAGAFLGFADFVAKELVDLII